MIKKYINIKIPSYIALGIIAMSAILVARYAYWEYMDILEEIYTVVEIKFSVEGERIALYSNCSETADFWIKASPEKKKEECNNILSAEFKLKYKDSESKKCILFKAEGESCPPPDSGTRLICIYECRGEEARQDIYQQD